MCLRKDLESVTVDLPTLAASQLREQGRPSPIRLIRPKYMEADWTRDEIRHFAAIHSLSVNVILIAPGTVMYGDFFSGR